MLDKGEGHRLELIQYLSPPGPLGGVERNDLGAAHLAFFIGDLGRSYSKTSQKGLKYNNAPAGNRGANGNVKMKACYAQDPDGNWLESVEIL